LPTGAIAWAPLVDRDKHQRRRSAESGCSPEASHDRVDAGERPFVGSAGHARASITVKDELVPGAARQPCWNRFPVLSGCVRHELSAETALCVKRRFKRDSRFDGAPVGPVGCDQLDTNRQLFRLGIDQNIDARHAEERPEAIEVGLAG